MPQKKGAGDRPQEYDADTGRFGEQSQKTVDSIRRYSDTPAEDLAAMGLPIGKVRTEDKPQLSKQEYATLRAEVMRKNAAQRGKVKRTNNAYTADNFYVYTTTGDDEFKVIEQYNIEQDRDEINRALSQFRGKRK